MQLSFMCFSQKTAEIAGNDERGLIFIDIMISGHCPVIWCISIVLPLTILKYKYLVSVVAFEAKKKWTLFSYKRNAWNHSKAQERSAQSCSSVFNSKRNTWNTPYIFRLTFIINSSAHRSEVLKLLHDLQRCKVVVLHSDLAAKPCW